MQYQIIKLEQKINLQNKKNKITLNIKMVYITVFSVENLKGKIWTLC